jgi:hypothetical protein
MGRDFTIHGSWSARQLNRNLGFRNSNLMVRNDSRPTLSCIRHLSFSAPGTVQNIRGFGNIGTGISVFLSGDPRRCARASYLRQSLLTPHLAVSPQTRNLNHEDEIHSGSVAGGILTGNISRRSGAQQRKRRTAADTRDGPRGRGSVLECCLHERPRPKPVRRADVGLWQPRRSLAIS